MASIRKYGQSGWRAFVRRKGITKTATFKSKREAQEWAAKIETIILAEASGQVKRPFREFIIRYVDEVTPTKRNAKWEYAFLMRLSKHPIADVIDLDETDVAAYRDERLKLVQGVTLLKEMAIMSNIFTIAIKEWKWAKENPFRNVRKPRPNPPRDRRITDEEIEKLKKAAHYSLPLRTMYAKSVHAFMFAIETAMRCGEIASLTWDNINFEKRTAFLPITKNGDSRTVPLSARAVELLKQLPRDSKYCFGTPRLSRVFTYVHQKAGIKGLHFHDSRHEAITRLSKKVDVLALARIVGHKRVNQLMTYYNESAEDLALKL